MVEGVNINNEGCWVGVVAWFYHFSCSQCFQTYGIFFKKKNRTLGIFVGTKLNA